LEGPLEGTGRSFAPGAARCLVDDLRLIRVGRVLGEEIVADARKVEPVQLQVVCSALWHSLPDDVRVISLDHVRRFADADRSLGGFSERVIAEVAREHAGGDTAWLRSWLRRTFITELGTREVVYQGETLTAGMPNAVVRALVDRHILREDVRAGTRWCELSHERLIQPILRGGDPGADPGGETVPATPQDYLRAAEISLRDGEFAAAARQAEEALRRCGDDTRLHAEIESFLGNVAHERDDADQHRDQEDLERPAESQVAEGAGAQRQADQGRGQPHPAGDDPVRERQGEADQPHLLGQRSPVLRDGHLGGQDPEVLRQRPHADR
ncbi:hypothetical protein ACFQ08_25185, partial [Streptosporangium algeriense]